MLGEAPLGSGPLGSDLFTSESGGNPYYTATANPPTRSSGRSVVIRDEFELIEAGFDEVESDMDLKANLAGPTFSGAVTFNTSVVNVSSGTVDLTGATTVTAPTPTSVADDSTKVATTAFVQDVLGAAGALLPVQTTHAGKFLKTNGTVASWELLTVNNSSLSGNTAIGASYSATYIKATTSPTLTLDAPATLGAGWYCFIENAGTGNVTLSHTSGNIDGLTSYVMYPGEARMLRCDGSTVTTTVISSFRKLHTTSTTITMPPGYRRLGFDMMGGGAGGSCGGRAAVTGPTLLGGNGGSGGGRYYGALDAPSAGTSITLTVGLGGSGAAARTTDGTPNAGSNGGQSEIVWSSTTRAFAGGGLVIGGVRAGGSSSANNAGTTLTAYGFVGSASSGAGAAGAEFGGATGAPADASGGSAGTAGMRSQYGGPGGGAGGGGVSGSTSGSAGGARGGAYNSSGGGGAAGTAGLDGGTAANSGGGGGGVGNAGSHARGGNGGNGTGYGSGGGGGGAAIGAINSGAGGNGADGYLDIWGEP